MLPSLCRFERNQHIIMLREAMPLSAIEKKVRAVEKIGLRDSQIPVKYWHPGKAASGAMLRHSEPHGGTSKSIRKVE
jgi:hypothetical protein